MLEALGDTPDQVAAALQVLGIQGVRNAARFLNPVVRYAQSHFPQGTCVDIIKGDRLRIVFASREVQEVAVPDAVLRFLEAFHRGQYPYLEMPIGPG